MEELRREEMKRVRGEMEGNGEKEEGSVLEEEKEAEGEKVGGDGEAMAMED